MQIGVRWDFGSDIPGSVPASLHEEIRRFESSHKAGASWTLTWLEGQPVCSLDGVPRVGHTDQFDSDEEDDDWLS